MEGSVRVAKCVMNWGSHFNNQFNLSLAMFTQVAAAVLGKITSIDTHWIWKEGTEHITVKPMKIEGVKLRFRINQDLESILKWIRF